MEYEERKEAFKAGFIAATPMAFVIGIAVGLIIAKVVGSL